MVALIKDFEISNCLKKQYNRKLATCKYRITNIIKTVLIMKKKLYTSKLYDSFGISCTIQCVRALCFLRRFIFAQLMSLVNADDRQSHSLSHHSLEWKKISALFAT